MRRPWSVIQRYHSIPQLSGGEELLPELCNVGLVKVILWNPVSRGRIPHLERPFYLEFKFKFQPAFRARLFTQFKFQRSFGARLFTKFKFFNV